MIVVVVVLVVLVVGAIVWARVAAARSESRSVESYEHALDVLGEVSKRTESTGLRVLPHEETGRPHVRTQGDGDEDEASSQRQAPGPTPPGPVPGPAAGPVPGPAVGPVPGQPPRLPPAGPPKLRFSRPGDPGYDRPAGEEPVVGERPVSSDDRPDYSASRPVPTFGSGDTAPTRSVREWVRPGEQPADSVPDAGVREPVNAETVLGGAATAGTGPGGDDRGTARETGGDAGRGAPPGRSSRPRTVEDLRRQRLVRRLATGVAAAVALVAVVGVAFSLTGGGTPSTTTTTRAAGAGKGTSTTTTGPAATATTQPTILKPTSATATDVAFTVPSTSYTVSLAATGGPTWLGIQQVAAGPYVWEETLPPGQSVTYKATGPIVIRIGAPPYTSIQVDGVSAQLPVTSQPYNVELTPGTASG